MRGDKKTIGVSPESQNVLDLISDKTLYRDQIDAARFAVAFALAKGLKPADKGDLATKWNIGSFDPSGNLRSVILAYYPECPAPYRFAEGLLEAGLQMLNEHIKIQGQIEIEIILNEIKKDTAKEAEKVTGEGDTRLEAYE